MDLAAADDTNVDTDNITSTTTGLSIAGSGENGSSVQLYSWDDAGGDADGSVDDGELTAVGTAGTVTGGAFSIDIDLAEGVHAVVAKQTDVAGNESAASAALDITVDTTADAAPTGLDLAAADDTNVDTDNITSTTTGLSIAGSGENGSSVQLYSWDDAGGDADGSVDDGELTAVGTAGTVTGGAFSIDIDLAEGVHAVVAKQTDVAGNESAASAALDITVDTTAAAPTGLDLAAADDTNVDTDNITSTTTGLSIAGSGENGSSVQLYSWDDAGGDADGSVDDGELTAVGTAGTVTGGAFSIDIDLAEGVHAVVAKQTDVAGNESAASAALDITVDTTAAAPTGLDLAAADDTNVDTDNITSTTTGLSIAGSGENGSSVQLYSWDDAGGDADGSVDDGELTAVGTAGTVTGGAFSIDIDLAEGVHAVVAKQTDVAGNESAASAALDITVDTTADAAPTGLDLAAADDTNVDTDNITSTTTGLSIAGSGENGSSVQLYSWDDAGGDADGSVDDGELTAVGTAGTVTGGAFSIDIDLAEGVHAVVAKQTDVAGNESAASAALDITVDTTAAAPTGLDLAAADDTNVDTDNITSTTTGLSIAGSGENGSSVQLYSWDDAGGDADGSVDDGELTAVGTAGTVTGGAFSIDIDLAEGVHAVVAKQTDVAGNESAASAALDITVDTTADAAPTGLDLAAADDTNVDTDNITSTTTGLSIAGSGENGSSVQLYSWDDAGGDADGSVDDGELTAVGTAGTVTGGAFSIDIDLAEGVHAVVAKQTDVAGNESAASAALDITVDTTADAAPTGLDLAAADDTNVDTDNITSTTTGLSIAGSGENGSSVQLYSWDDAGGDADGSVDDGELTAVGTAGTVTGGAFSIDIDLAEGVHAVVAKQTDVAGNESAASAALDITVDTTADAAPTQ